MSMAGDRPLSIWQSSHDATRGRPLTSGMVRSSRTSSRSSLLASNVDGSAEQETRFGVGLDCRPHPSVMTIASSVLSNTDRNKPSSVGGFEARTILKVRAKNATAGRTGSARRRATETHLRTTRAGRCNVSDIRPPTRRGWRAYATHRHHHTSYFRHLNAPTPPRIYQPARARAAHRHRHARSCERCRRAELSKLSPST